MQEPTPLSYLLIPLPPSNPRPRHQGSVSLSPSSLSPVSTSLYYFTLFHPCCVSASASAAALASASSSSVITSRATDSCSHLLRRICLIALQICLLLCPPPPSTKLPFMIKPLPIRSLKVPSPISKSRSLVFQRRLLSIFFQALLLQPHSPYSVDGLVRTLTVKSFPVVPSAWMYIGERT